VKAQQGQIIIPPSSFSSVSRYTIREGHFPCLAPGLKQVTWADKFKPGSTDKYDGSSNQEEFIQVYHTVIEAVGGDDQISVNYLLTVLSGVARSWLINLSKGTIYNCHVHRELLEHIRASLSY
jgi:hypothetical protein